MKVWKIIFLSKWMICRFHLNLPGCNLRGCIVFVQFSNQSNLGTFRTANGPPDAPRHLPENAASALPPRLLKRKKRLRWGRRLLFMTILARLPQIFIPRLENHIYIYTYIDRYILWSTNVIVIEEISVFITNLQPQRYFNTSGMFCLESPGPPHLRFFAPWPNCRPRKPSLHNRPTARQGGECLPGNPRQRPRGWFKLLHHVQVRFLAHPMSLISGAMYFGS